MGDYQRLQTEAENEVQVSALDGTRSGENLYYAKPMSVLHKICFALSIILCAAVVIIFIWVLPCNLDTCTANNENDIFSWNRTLIGLELKGPLHFVDGNLIGLLRGALWGKTIKGEYPPHTGGVVALMGKSGEVAWFARLGYNMPTHLDCSLLDIDSNGVKDCLVVGNNGYLAAIHSSGVITWKVHSANLSLWPQPKELEVPILVGDLDGDGSSDLAMLSKFTPGQHRLLLVSSRTGAIILEPLLSSDCAHVYNLTYYPSSAAFLYTCSRFDGGYSFLSQSLPGVSDKSSSNRGVWTNPPLEKKWKERSRETTGEHRVVLNNTGSCPTNCMVAVNVTDSQNRTIWSYRSHGVYAMSPVPLHFKHSITGFLLKFWQWHATNKTGDLRIELIKERIVLIAFTKSGDKHVVNASQTDIIQICNGTECQPQLSFQTQSALIADVNGDGSQDLVSYCVSYRPTRDIPPQSATEEEWELESSVRVVRLEAELPKLYEAVSKL